MAAPWLLLTRGRRANRSDVWILMKTSAKRRGGKGGPYCGLLGLRETTGWAGGVIFFPRAMAHGEGSPQLFSSDGDSHNGVATL
jgi:hypothetical protein